MATSTSSRTRLAITMILLPVLAGFVFATQPANPSYAQTGRPTLVVTAVPSATPQPTAEPFTPTLEPTPTLPPTTEPSIIPDEPIPQQAGALRLEITKTLIGSDLIQVGQYLTFTIRIRNTGSITITTLPLIDEYDPTVLQPALSRFQPAPTTSADGRLDWADLTDLPGFGDLPPNNEFLVTTVFRAIGISENVINRARVEAAVGSGGAGGAPIESGDGGNVQGGRVIIEKALPEQVIRADAPVVTFVITIRNEGAADLVRVPVEDRFDPAYLRFIEASPAPNSHDPTSGLLRWDDMLSSVGLTRLQPGAVITATTTFALLAPIDNLVVNRVGGINVRDEFGNAVQAPRQADVRIRIVGVADTRPTATSVPNEDREPATPTPTEIATAVATPAPEATGVAPIAETPQPIAAVAPTGPTSLPQTSEQPSISPLLWIALMIVGVALAVRRRAE